MFISRLAKVILRLGGWTMVGSEPSVHKAVVIAAPHTSNWDGFWALVYTVAAGLEVRFFAKDSLFRFPLGPILRSLGAVPLDRSNPGAAVKRAIAFFDSPGRAYFGLAPEGTRGSVTGWKSGFYRIAEGAGVPVCLGFLDYGNRRLGLGPLLTLTGDVAADMRICRDFYAAIEGRHPRQTGPVAIR